MGRGGPGRFVLHVCVIALLAAVVLHGGLPDALRAGPGSGSGALWIALAVLGFMGALAAVQHILITAASRVLDRTGDWRAVALAERTLVGARIGAVLVHVVAVLVLGWAGAVRAVMGDLVVLDEAVIIAPALAVFVLGWWSFYPIEKRLRDATLIRSLDAGEPVYPHPSRGAWVLGNVRHQLMLSLGPLLLIGAWSEGLERVLRLLATTSLAPRLESAGLISSTPGVDAPATALVRLAGVVIVFALSPLLLRRVWDTVRLGPGPLRERLETMCARAGVRVRDVLVWRTHGVIVNAAVMGIAGPLRYILLTDALIDRLPTRQVEAVMAHEVGHARLAHVPWLVMSLLAAIGGVSAAGIVALMGIETLMRSSGVPAATLNLPLYAGYAGVQVLGLVIGLLVLGVVSRRFEWQADAYAAKRLSAPDSSPAPIPEDGVERVTAEAADAMTGALDSVARLNHIPRARWTWRHGSIAERQRRLRALVGVPVDRVPIDRTVRRIKWLAGVGMILVVGAAIADWMLASQAAHAAQTTIVGDTP